MALTGRATLDFRLLDQQTPLAVLSIYIYISWRDWRRQGQTQSQKHDERRLHHREWGGGVEPAPSSSSACRAFTGQCLASMPLISSLSSSSVTYFARAAVVYLFFASRSQRMLWKNRVPAFLLFVLSVYLPSSIYRSMHQLLFVVGSFMFSNEQKTIRKTAKKKKLLATIIPQEVKLFCLENWCGTLEWFYLHKENETSICAAVSKLSRTTQGSWRGMLHASDRCLARRPAILSKIRTMFFAFKNTF